MPKRVVQFRGSDAMLGAERAVLELSKRTPEFGYESVIVALQGPHDPEPELVKLAREAGIQTEILHCHGRLDPSVFSRLRRFVRDERVDLLHCHGYKENFYGLFARAGVPVVANNHLWKRTSRALQLYCWLDAKLVRHFDHVIAVSEPIRQELLQVGVSPNKVSKIANGIDTTPYRQPLLASDRDTVRESLGATPSHVVIGMLSSFGREKGHRYAFDAVAQLREQYPELLLAVVGDGPEAAALREEATRRGLDPNIRFCGRRSDVADVVRAFDVFLLPSLIEGLPMALLEAMAAGRPPVASRVGDVPAVVHDDVTGLLTAPGDSTALASALARLIRDQDLRGRLGRAAADIVELQFSSRQMARQYCALYDRLQLAPTSLIAREQEE